MLCQLGTFIYLFILFYFTLFNFDLHVKLYQKWLIISY